jgi:hypothetical protein
MRAFRYTSLLLFFLAACLAAQAGEPYFCTFGNRTLRYERYKYGTTKLVQTTTLEIGEIETEVDTRKVHYSMLLQEANGRNIFGGEAEQTTIIDPNGDVWMDFGATVSSVLKNMFPSFRISHEGDAVAMPADMKPGDILPDSHCVVTVGIFKITVDVTERTVLREEQITTPAGTFDCVVAHEHKVEKGPMHHVDVWSDTWYARGIGYVRHDEYDRKMRLETTEILIQDLQR